MLVRDGSNHRGCSQLGPRVVNVSLGDFSEPTGARGHPPPAGLPRQPDRPNRIPNNLPRRKQGCQDLPNAVVHPWFPRLPGEAYPAPDWLSPGAPYGGHGRLKLSIQQCLGELQGEPGSPADRLPLFHVAVVEDFHALGLQFIEQGFSQRPIESWQQFLSSPSRSQGHLHAHGGKDGCVFQGNDPRSLDKQIGGFTSQCVDGVRIVNMLFIEGKRRESSCFGACGQDRCPAVEGIPGRSCFEPSPACTRCLGPCR